MTTQDQKAPEGLDPEKDPDVATDSQEDLDPGPDSKSESGSDPNFNSDSDSDSDLDSDSGSDSGEEEVVSEATESPGMDEAPELEGGSSAEPGEEGLSELEEALEELRRLRDQHLRLAADFENHRKRASADLTGVWLRAQAELVRALVEGLDDLQRVSRFTSEDTTVEALIEGVDLVERNLLKALTDAGLEVLNPEGERFDPNRMEAMMRVATEEEGQDETVHQVFQKGYMFKDQLVRPARVSVYMDED